MNSNNDQPHDGVGRFSARHHRMYELEYPAPLRSSDDSQQEMPLIIALQGYADAGQAVSHVAAHVLQALDHSAVASFRIDELIDYRARRPAVTLDHSELVDIEELELELNVVKDTDGKSFLLLSGPEPDLKWEAFADAVVELARRTGVHRVISLYSTAMTVPHTRPTVLTAHSSHKDLIRDYLTWDARMIVPGAAALRTELKLSQQGIETVGLTAHVPHYIAATDYPAATSALLRACSNLADRRIPVAALDDDIARVKQQLAEQVDDSQEIATVVGALEQQYDAEMDRRRKRADNALVAPGEDIPTSEELGAEFEAFLAELNRKSSPFGREDNSSKGSESNPNDDEGDNPGEAGEEGA